MESKTLVKALKMAVREVIQEELTEILREGLQSTINEMAQPKKTVKSDTVHVPPRMVHETKGVKNKVQFKNTGFADILNQTPSLREETSPAVASFADLMKEETETLSFTSADAQGFGMLRANQMPRQQAPTVIEDPETGKTLNVDPIVAKAMTKDYSALMKAIDKKKGLG